MKKDEGDMLIPNKPPLNRAKGQTLSQESEVKRGIAEWTGVLLPAKWV